ncbi:MAG TPA: cation:proton antiporter subunit C [Solirubrobacterales bacterium]|jgi:multicomponent Na+:H+ antiporter subunit C|nr:cation:proton antiporter subunit C [Solirubrobacterales bacterium]
MTVFPFLVAIWILCWGLYGIVSSRNLVHLVICLGVTQAATYVLLLGVGYRNGGAAPIYADIAESTMVVDPVVQALALVDVVVEATVSALLLAVAVQTHKRFGTIDPDELHSLRG